MDPNLLFEENGILRSDVRSMVKNIRRIVCHFRKSRKSRDCLRKYNTLAPMVDVKTRWSSSYYMVVRFYQLVPDIRKASIDSNDIRKLIDFLNYDTERALESLICLLKPFEEATKLLSGEDCNLITADLIIQIV